MSETLQRLELGGCPAEEECAQIGVIEDAQKFNRLECRAYIEALKKVYGQPPLGVEFRVKGNSHDFGTYYEVVLIFEASCDGAWDYANKVEAGLAKWSDANFWTPVMYSENGRGEPISVMELEMLDRAKNPKAYPTRARLQEEWQIDFEVAVKVCADGVAQLRPVDLCRVIHIAYNQGPSEAGEEYHLAHARAFVAWLRKERPDLEAKIAKAVAELEEFENIKLAA